jgi:hypothetical protein
MIFLAIIVVSLSELQGNFMTIFSSLFFLSKSIIYIYIISALVVSHPFSYVINSQQNEQYPAPSTSRK